MKKVYFFLWAAVFLFCLPMVGRAQVVIDETTFPDSVFRKYVREKFDTERDGTLSEEECGAVTRIDVSGGTSLADLTGIEHFPALEDLSCYGTGITSLDVSQNLALKNLACYDTRREVRAEVGGTYDLSRLPGFDVSRASNWKGGNVQGSVLTFNDTAVTYQYATLYAGENEAVPATLEFKLVANPDAEDDAGISPHPSVVPFAAYAKEGNLYLQGIRGMVEVFDLQGRRIYRGTANPVALPSQGVYIVRNQGSSLKVPNL